MSRRLRWTAALLALLGLGGSGCASIRHYERGLPKRLETEKREVGEPELRLEAAELPGGRIEIWVGARRPVEVHRSVVYQTSEIRYEWSPWGELLEIPLGIPWIPAAAILMAYYGAMPDEPNRRTDRFWWFESWILAPINPAQSLLFPDVVRDPHCEREIFVDEPVTTRFAMSLSVEGAAVRCVFTDAGGAELLHTEATTDAFGRIVLDPPPPGAAWLAAESGGKRLRHRLRAAPADPAPPRPRADPGANTTK